MSSSHDVRDYLDKLSGGGRSAFPQDCPIGTTVRGVVTDARIEQQTDVNDGSLKFFKSGTPMMVLVLTVQTDERDDDEDDGLRSVWARGGNYTVESGEGTAMAPAIRDAMKDAGVDAETLVGSTLAVRKSGLGKRTAAGRSQPNLYVAKVTKGVAVTQSALDDL